MKFENQTVKDIARGALVFFIIFLSAFLLANLDEFVHPSADGHFKLETLSFSRTFYYAVFMFSTGITYDLVKSAASEKEFPFWSVTIFATSLLGAICLGIFGQEDTAYSGLALNGIVVLGLVSLISAILAYRGHHPEPIQKFSSFYVNVSVPFAPNSPIQIINFASPFENECISIWPMNVTAQSAKISSVSKKSIMVTFPNAVPTNQTPLLPACFKVIGY